jgi:hypothetical protein
VLVAAARVLVAAERGRSADRRLPVVLRARSLGGVVRKI